ncbi:uncharacterized protein [Chelonus insularis]|uniref:uncharacterized protein n=1 Tax=Chelonus insularis TaxID=460826 RepID=UPI00158E154F|nr:uncharacterized protein LOC118072905 [Chelonus insularis]
MSDGFKLVQIHRKKMNILWFLFGLFIITNSEDTDCKDRNWHSLENPHTATLECGPEFQNRCLCSRVCYEGIHQYVVNCTNSGFIDTIPLENLPNKTEILIFTGNTLTKLPENIFGTTDRVPNLRVIDMSNNKIREISGKSFHHVRNVQRLNLDFNEISVTNQSNHPRVFSNFLSLLELHLTDAFEDHPPRRDLAETLHNIFVNSHLDQLIKLHLEQNEISEFRDPNVFCNLPNLLDLHLGDNELSALHFNLSCLHKLRFLDLQRNNFTRVLERDMKTLDTFAKHNQTVTIDLSNNKFECSWRLNPFIKWMKKTKVVVRNKNFLYCYDHGHEKPLQEISNYLPKIHGSTVAIVLLSIILVILIGALIYVQRQDLKKKIAPVIASVNKRVRYTSIATMDGKENDRVSVKFYYFNCFEMATTERLHLDEIISSVPELGPSVSNAKYMWIIFISLMIVQITVPSVISMYGIILGYLATNSSKNFDVWNEEIILTPILFTAFYHLADPWTRIIVNLASAPRIIGLIGVGLLSVGVLASGYLATGGVGAYLASSSAGAVMGIGGSLILIQTDVVLRKNFRSHLQKVLICKEISTCLGYILAPIFIFFILSSNFSLHVASLLMASIFIPTALGILFYHYPTVKPSTSSYMLLIADEDNNVHEENSTRNLIRHEEPYSGNTPDYLFGEGSETFSYMQGLEDDQELFNVTTQHISNLKFEWKQILRVMKSGKFWIGVITWIGCKVNSLLIWILLPSIVIRSSDLSFELIRGVVATIMVAIGTFIPNMIAIWKPNSARTRSLCFGAASWLGCLVLFGLSTLPLGDAKFLVVGFLGGISIGGMSVFLESIILDILDNSIAKKAHMVFSTIVGLSILGFIFISNSTICLHLTAITELIAGCYWLIFPIVEIIRAR